MATVVSTDPLVDGWIATIRSELEAADEPKSGPRFDPLGHKLVQRLLPAYLEELAAAEARKAELDSRIEEAEHKGDEGDEGDEDLAEQLTPVQLKALKQELTATRKTLRELRAALLKRLDAARAKLSLEDCQRHVLDIARDDLVEEVERYMTEHRQHVVGTVENWWDKYRIPLREVEEERDAATERLGEMLRMVGYES